MPRTTLHFALLLLPLTLTGAVPAPPDAPMVLAESLVRADGSLGCRVTVKANNASRSDVWLMSEDSRVRAKIGTIVKAWGSWKRFPMSNRRIRPGETATMVAELDLGCRTTRQYEFTFKRGSDQALRRFGGTGTDRTLIDLGKVNELF